MYAELILTKKIQYQYLQGHILPLNPYVNYSSVAEKQECQKLIIEWINETKFFSFSKDMLESSATKRFWDFDEKIIVLEIIDYMRSHSTHLYLILELLLDQFIEIPIWLKGDIEKINEYWLDFYDREYTSQRVLQLESA